MVAAAVRAFIVLVAVATSACATGGGQCSKATELQPALCPTDLPSIDKITIIENAVRARTATPDDVDCSDFVVTTSQVTRFFSAAKAVDEGDARETLDWSPCYARGEVTFRDGTKGSWSVDQFRGGALVVGGARKLSLYCPDCRYRPFKW